jgi:hypothetical protein
MSYRGRVKEGVVVLEGGIRLAEGTEVEVLPVAQTPAPPAGGLGQRLLKHAATVKGMPSDLARNHDHYIHGTPRK